jgi:phytoene dehydrogenase-like protein
VTDYDAVVVGAGPNGLAAAITLARAGAAVLLVEAKETIGGGTRSAALTLPGYTHDVCSAIHPLGVVSPFFRTLPLDQFGLEWVYPPVELAHPLGNGEAALITRSVEETADRLGRDGRAYRRLFAPLVARYEELLHEFLGPLRLPKYPLTMARFGMRAILPAATLARMLYRNDPARALFAGMAAHAIMPLERPATAGFGLILTTLAHAVGWPMARGGSQQIADALGAYFESLGGRIETGRTVESVDELPQARAYLLDVTPRQLTRIAGGRLPRRYRRQLSRYRYGPGVFKIDYALAGPIPWRAAGVHQAATVHVGGTLPEIAASERAVWQGQPSERPFVLVVQQSQFDSSRAPNGNHTAWAYCHVPNGSPQDMTGRIEAQIERFAPGFRDCVLARHTHSAAQLEGYNPNYIGGDINGGVQDLGQLFTRPVASLSPYRTPASGIYICSSSTPPGGGVHGMCGYYAAQAALADM